MFKFNLRVNYLGKKGIFIAMLLIIIIPVIPLSVSADGCIFIPKNFDIYEPGQNAIIA
jgi:hypothetical protein